MLTTSIATKETRSSIKMTAFKLVLLPLCDKNQAPPISCSLYMKPTIDAHHF
jgi:hypothetical protein